MPLAVQHGTEEAQRILLNNLYQALSASAERDALEGSINQRLAAFKRDQFSVWHEHDGKKRNVCFPLISGNQVYGLSFLFKITKRTNLPRTFLKCSDLAARMRNILSNP